MHYNFEPKKGFSSKKHNAIHASSTSYEYLGRYFEFDLWHSSSSIVWIRSDYHGISIRIESTGHFKDSSNNRLEGSNCPFWVLLSVFIQDLIPGRAVSLLHECDQFNWFSENPGIKTFLLVLIFEILISRDFAGFPVNILFNLNFNHSHLIHRILWKHSTKRYTIIDVDYLFF